MKIISVQFDYPFNNGAYKKLAKVFEFSIKKNCPNVELELLHVDPPVIKHKLRSKSFASNTLKIDLWLKCLKETDQDVIFMDCDMIVLKDLSCVFNDKTFDIGYAKRTSAHMPYNGGIVFVRNTLAAIEFIELWRNINNKMYNDYSFHHKYRNKYAGMNQAAFGYILENEKYKAKLKSFPCSVWDACCEDWPTVGENTKVIHVKGALRRTILMNSSIQSCRYRRAVIIWRNMAIQAGLINAPLLNIDTSETINAHPLISRVRGLHRRYRNY